jgi:hypothetical protein
VIEIKKLQILCHLIIDETRCIVIIPYIKHYYLKKYIDLDNLIGNSQSYDICERLGKKLLLFVKNQIKIENGEDNLNIQNILSKALIIIIIKTTSYHLVKYLMKN